MKTFWRALIGILVLLVVLVSAAAIYVSRMDPARYGALLADTVRDATGRELHTGSGIRLAFLPRISIDASDVTFANAAWAAQKEMVSVAQLSAEIAWLPLLGGEVLVTRLVLVEPRILLETDAKGRGNWELAGSGETPAKRAGSAKRSPGFTLDVSDMRIEKADIRYRDGVSGRTADVRIDELEIAEALFGDSMTVRLRGAYQGLDVSVDGTLGALDRILADESVDVDLNAAAGTAKMHVAGEIARPLQAQGLDLRVQASAPGTKPFTDLAGVDFDDVGPVALKARLVGENGDYRLDDVELSARGLGADVTARGSVTALTSDPAPDLRIHLEATSTKRLTDLAGIELEDMGPVEAEARLVRREQHFDLLDVRAKGSGLGADASAQGSVRDLGARPRPDLTLELSAASTTGLARLAGIDVRDLGPLQFTGKLVAKDGGLDMQDIELRASPDTVKIHVRGSVASLADKPRPDVTVSAEAASLRGLMETLPDVGPVELSARVESRGHVIDILELDARVGKSDLSGKLTVDLGGARPRADGELRAKSLDLDELVPETPQTSARDGKRGDGRVFSDAPIPLDGLGAADASIRLVAERVRARRLDIEITSLALELEDRRLSVKPRLELAGGRIAGQVDVDATAALPKVSVRVDGKALKVGEVSKAVRDEPIIRDAPADLSVDVKGSGDSVRALMAGLDGRFALHIGRGQLLGDRINVAGGDFVTQLLGNVIPSGNEDSSILECAVVRFEILDGFAVADQSLVLETNEVLAKGGGAIDLASEQIDLGARMKARTGLRIGAGSLASLMKVEGTLAEPHVGVDLKSVAGAGVRVAGAVFTMGLSLVAEDVYGELADDGKPCATALAREFPPRERGGGSAIALPGAKAVTQGVESVTKGAGGLLESIGSGIESIFSGGSPPAKAQDPTGASDGDSGR